jgi:hypothetical protein
MKLLFVLISFIVCSLSVSSQTYTRGIPDGVDTTIQSFDIKSTLITSDYKSVASSASLKDYCPTPGNQGSYGTCAAWATAYAARTIVEAEKNEWKNKAVINSNTFSPGFIFKYNKPYDDKCNGAHPSDLFEKMKVVGVPKYKDFNYDCVYPTAEIFPKAVAYKIQDAVQVFYNYSEYDLTNDAIYKVKKSIYEGNPVVISMFCPSSFDKATDVWNPFEPKTQIEGRMHGKHAICVIGYDDMKYGGAVEIMNSWGTNWGNGGFTWIRYSDFKKYVYAGVELIKFDKFISPIENAQYGGKIKLTNLDENEIALQQINSDYYKVKKTLTSNDRFRIYASNFKPANLYIIGADLKKSVNLLFPYKQNISPALNYSNATIAFPDEEHHIKLGQTKGTDYLIFLYVKEKIDINELMNKLKTSSLPYTQIIKQYFGDKLISSNDVKSDGNQLNFSTSNEKGGVLSLFVEIDHQ